MAAAGVFQINLVASPFRAETTAAIQTTHSEDLSPSGSSISTAYWCLNRRSARVPLNLSTIAWSR